MSKYFVTAEECSRHHLFPGVDIATAAGERLMLSVVRFAPEDVVPVHSHPHEQMGLLLEGTLDFTVGDERQTLTAGQMWRIPPHVEHTVVAIGGPARALDVFHPIRDDYR